MPSIGKYNNTNNLVIILNGKYSFKEEVPKKEEKISKNIKNKGILGLKLNKNKTHINFFKSLNEQQKNSLQNKEEIKEAESNKIIKKEKNETDKLSIKISEEIEDLLNIMIDTRKINKKIKSSLDKSIKQETYCPLNYNWLKKYLENTKLNDIYNNQSIYDTIDNIISKPNEHMTNSEILLNLQNQPDIMKIINKNQINSPINNNLLKDVNASPLKIKINDIFYYNNFILVQENIMKKLLNNLQSIKFNCYFGDNKAFILFNNNSSSILIEVYNLVNNIFAPEIFYHFYGENEFKRSFNNLKEQGYQKYTNFYLIFNNQDKKYKDYTSPIFDKENKEIGIAYKYDSNINNYDPYIISNEYKAILKLYFYYQKIKLSTIKEKEKKYY